MRQHEFIRQFLEKSETVLRKIARLTRQTFEELQQTIWLITLEREQKRGVPVDLGSTEEKRLLLRDIERAYSGDLRRKRRGLSLDLQWRDGNGEETPSLLDSIRALDDSNPLEALLQEEDHAARLAILTRLRSETYSQFSAYVVLIMKFDCIKEEVAVHLAVSAATLDRRVRHSYLITTKQPSLFDRIVSIQRDFFPPQRFAAPKRQPCTFTSGQRDLDLPLDGSPPDGKRCVAV